MERKYLLVGGGRLAQHLEHWFGLKGISLKTWDRSQDPHILPRHLESVTHVLLAISDDAILGFYQRFLMGLNCKVIHFSGARSFEGLIGAHPLMTFSNELYDEEFYDQISWAIDAQDKFREIFPELPNKSFQIAPEQKPLYHALCVLGGNLPQILWSMVEAQSEKLGIPKGLWQTYWQQSLDNFTALGKSAVTGPLVRGDEQTLSMDQLALSKASDFSADIFQSFVRGSQTEEFKKLMQKETSGKGI